MWYLEEYFKEVAEKENLYYLFEDYENIKDKENIPKLFSDAQNDYKFLNLIDRGDSRNHFDEIIEKIGKVIEPFEKRLNLNAKELYVLLSAVYLHDIAKAYPLLRVPKLGTLTEVLSRDNIKDIEKAHSFDAFRILILLPHSHYHKNIGINGMDYFPCKKLSEMGIFGKITDSNEKIRLVSAIAYTCGVHKCFSFKSEEEMKKRLDSFLNCREDRDKTGEVQNCRSWEESGWNITNVLYNCEEEKIRIDLIATLLKLGDCLDITKKRIKEKSLWNALKMVKLGRDEEIDKIITKWIQFYLTDEVYVGEPEDIKKINIIVKYRIPMDLNRTQFLHFREMAERDLEDQSFLKIIEYHQTLKPVNSYAE